MQTQALFHETLADALRECVAVCGGMKAVGSKLWPEKEPDMAGRQLADCLFGRRLRMVRGLKTWVCAGCAKGPAR